MTVATMTREAGAQHELTQLEALRHENRLLAARIVQLETEVKDERDDRLMAELERDMTRTALANHQRRETDWKFQLADGADVHVRFDGPGAKHPGCPRSSVPHTALINRFFASLRQAAARATLAAAS